VRMGLHTGEPRVTEEGTSAARCTKPRASPPPALGRSLPPLSRARRLENSRGRETKPALRQTVRIVLGALLSIVLSAFLIGALARFALPGPDPMPFWLTVFLGLGGSLVGGGIAAAIYGGSHVFDSSGHAFVTLLLEIGAAIVLLALYRRYVQRRPLTGASAHAFPTRGIGINRMRARLRQLGIDPDRATGWRRGPSSPLSPAELADALEKLRELHDQGKLGDEEYERARERLRRY
jgi:uncharacterized membrane protein YeaQ/YmgE (transglycosylase-associated protein family)